MVPHIYSVYSGKAMTIAFVCGSLFHKDCCHRGSVWWNVDTTYKGLKPSLILRSQIAQGRMRAEISHEGKAFSAYLLVFFTSGSTRRMPNAHICSD